MSGFFIVFEGGEGSGKTTQVSPLVERLAEEGLDVLALREPGGTPVGDRVRDVLLDVANGGMGAVTEAMLYEACRAELVAKRIAPHLASGGVVVCDRFTDSTLAYQGYGRGLDLGVLRGLSDVATGGLRPDLTVVFDIVPEVGLERATMLCADRLEREEVAFHERVRAGFLEIAAAGGPERYAVIDASSPAAEVADRVWGAVRCRLASADLLEDAR